MSFFDSTGLNIPTQAETLEGTKTRMRAKWGENIAVDDVDSNMGRKAALLAEAKNDVLQDMAATVAGLLPSTSSGALLRELVKFNGIEVNESVYSTVVLSCTANVAGTTIPAGSLVGTEDGATFAIDSEMVISSEATDTAVNATCTEAGAIVAAAGTITQILTPVFGWESVTNVAAAVLGRAEETDPALRARRARAARGVGLHHQSKIKTTIENIEGVTACRVEIDTTEDNPLRVIVRGGDDQDIGDVLFGVGTAAEGAGSVAAGIGTRGAVAVECTDEGQTGYVYFDRSQDVPIYITIRTRKYNAYPANGDALMKQYIVELFEGNLEIEGGEVPKQELGDAVYATDIMAAARAVPGHKIVSVVVGTSATPTETVLTMESHQLAVTSAEYIQVIGA